MLYMVIERYRSGPEPVYERAAARGRMLPAGLVYVNSWVVDDGGMDRCFQLMETSDPALFDSWFERWSDLVSFEVYPVITSAEAAARARLWPPADSQLRCGEASYHWAFGEVGDMPGLSSWGVFLSYRREDSAPYARSLEEQFRQSLPDARVFMDLDSIEPGLDFAEVIREAVDSCAVLVALIGPKWATITDGKGRPRLYNPDDWVRVEVQTALDRGVRVIPVLVDGARPLGQELLPAELHKLARLNVLELSYDRYQYDADRLVEAIKRVLAAAPGTGTARQSPPAAAAEDRTARRDVRPGSDAPSEVAAPAEASQALPQVAGRWRDNFGYWLHIQQDGAAITTVTTDTSGNPVSQGQGTIKGRTITYTASSPGGQVMQGEFTVSPDGNTIQGRLDISMFGTPLQILNEVLVRA